MHEDKKTKSSSYFTVSMSTFLVIISLFMSFLLFLGIYIISAREILNAAAWMGFFGSLIGGILGFAGAIVAVRITTKETREIQKKAQENFEYDKKVQREFQRNLFTDDIAVITSEYITDIFKYYYNNRHSELIQDDLKRAKDELNDLIKELEKDPNNSDSLNIKIEIAKLNYREAERIAEHRKIDKSIAIQKYYLLKIKLNGIDLAKQFIDQLEDIERVHCLSGISPNDFNVEIDKLRTYLLEFTNKYINQ